MRLSKERIEEIRQRCEAATEGPWHPHDTASLKGVAAGKLPRAAWIQHSKKGTAKRICYMNRGDFSDGDRSFIVHSRADIPDLLSEIDRLNKVVEAQKEGIRNAIDTCRGDNHRKTPSLWNVEEILEAAELEARKEEE